MKKNLSEERIRFLVEHGGDIPARDMDDFTKLEAKLKGENNLLQVGADMTTGLGWCSVDMKEVE